MTRDWTGNSKSGIAALAPSNHALAERADRDYYATEPKATELLMGLETFAPRIWEPACGGGHISEVLRRHGYEVRESDIVDRIGNEVLDFLAGGGIFGVGQWDGDIVTNPPYSMAGEFVERALECVKDGAKVAFFLKLTFLESAKRRSLFEKYPPPPGVGEPQPPRLLAQRHPLRKQTHRIRLVRLGKRLPRRPGNQMVQLERSEG